MKGRKNPGTREQVIEAIQTVAQELGRAPHIRELELKGGVPESLARRLFGTFHGAIRAAGLEPTPGGPEGPTPNERLLEDWGAVARRLGRTPTYREYAQTGQYAPPTLAARFSGWRRVAEAFVEAEARGSLEGEWKDVREIIRRRAPWGWSAEGRWKRSLLMKVLRASRKKPAPSTEAGPAPLPPLAGMRCVTATMLTTLVASTVLGGGFLRRVMTDRPLLGPPMHAAGLTHEPVNEMGVSMLFAMSARQLGFIIESVQTGFPDCRAKMEVLPGRWQDVRIEFEYESRSFVNHCHYPRGCDVIVCWKHNWPGCPKEMVVVELSKALSIRQSAIS